MKLTVKSVVKMPEPIKDFGTNDYERGETSGYNSAISKIGNMEISMLSEKELYKLWYSMNDTLDPWVARFIKDLCAKFPTANPVSCEHEWERKDDFCQYCIKCDVMRHSLDLLASDLELACGVPKERCIPIAETLLTMGYSRGPKPPVKEELDEKAVFDLLNDEMGECEDPDCLTCMNCNANVAKLICAKFAVTNKPVKE